MAEWSNELALHFLEMYAAEPVLYDPKHPHHKHKKMVNNAWDRIQQNFGVDMPVSEIKKKKDSLMASFRYQMRRRKEAMAMMGGPSVKTSWFAFDFMHGFLGQIYENETVEDSEPILEFVGFDALDDSSPNDSPSTTQDSYQNVPEIKQEVIDPEEPLQSNAQGDKSKLNQKEHKQKTASKRIKHSPHVLELPEDLEYEEDDCDLYGKLIAKKLRKLPEPQRERLMYEIQGLFVKVSQSSILQYRLTS